MKKEKLVVISGASGVGKGTVLAAMMRMRPDLQFSVSATTREPRPNETDGVHYFFVTKERFEEMIRHVAFYDFYPFVSTKLPYNFSYFLTVLPINSFSPILRGEHIVYNCKYSIYVLYYYYARWRI